MIANRQPSEVLDRLPPSDLDAERWVLGSVLLYPACLDELRLRPEDFYSDANRRIYAAMRAMTESGGRLDVGLLVGHLRSAGELEAVGGQAYLAEIAYSVPMAAHVGYYAGIVAELAQKRAVIHAATLTLRDAYDPCLNAADLLNAAETRLAEIETGATTGEPRIFAELAGLALERVAAVHDRGQSAGILAGLYDFDQQIGGWFPGEVAIVAARPSGGKTAFACQCAKRSAKRGPVYFASLEMSGEELFTRMAASDAGVELSKVRSGRMDSAERVKFTEAANRLHALPLVVDDRPQATANDVRRGAVRWKRHGLSMIVLDYLQLVSPANRKVNRYEQIGEMTRTLKATARELDVPLLCLAQLSRAAEQNDRPKMSHLRESGNIEQDADVIAFLVPGNFKDDFYQWNIELDVAKNRNGGTVGIYKLNKTGGLFECIHQPKAFEEFAAHSGDDF